MTIQDTIRLEAAGIREKLRGGKLYGQPLNMQDPDAMLVAAYLLGNHEGVWSPPATELPERVSGSYPPLPDSEWMSDG